ncbi:hypothetical protein [Candidatus Protochlamydia phocaeensis]|uniref:hypothetical protein n=1 Tax=Candidatus Protochlamydia phocaeensis TaxID=1414722 RepID=UPI000837C585|nr:hypothetical protein [Candidatus Protochlamydia phocaeensis]
MFAKDPDKILIIAAILLILSGYFFKDRIVEEAHLFKEAEGFSQKLLTTYFYPLSQQERLAVFQDSLKKMEAMQERASNSLLVKYFFDFRELIQEQQEDIQELERQEPHEGFVSFLTSNLANVIANRHFSNEQLLQLGHLIDEELPESNQAVYLLNREENHQLLLEIMLHQPLDSMDQKRFQALADRASVSIFNGEPVNLLVGSFADKEDILEFKSQESDQVANEA